MITVPPFTAFVFVVTLANRVIGPAFRSGRTLNFWILALLTVFWLWVVLAALPGLADYLTR